MTFYKLLLDDEAQNGVPLSHPLDLLTITKYIPMNLVNSKVFSQARVEEVLRGIDDTEVYTDDI